MAQVILFGQVVPDRRAETPVLCQSMVTAPCPMLMLGLLASIGAASIPPDAIKPLAIGFVGGFVSDGGQDVMMCGQLALGEGVHFEHALKDFKDGVTHFNMTEIEAGVQEIKDAIKGIPTV